MASADLFAAFRFASCFVVCRYILVWLLQRALGGVCKSTHISRPFAWVLGDLIRWLFSGSSINSLAGYCAFFRPNTYNILKLTLVQNRDTGHGCSVSFFLLGMCLFKKEMVGFHVLVSLFSGIVEILEIFSGIQLFTIIVWFIDVLFLSCSKRHIFK
jgi:hypothetical protein